MSVTIVRQHKDCRLAEDGLYPVLTFGPLSIAVALCEMQGANAVPVELLALIPYRGVIYAPVPQEGLHFGILAAATKGWYALPMTVEGLPICEDGPSDPNGTGPMPVANNLSSLCIAHRIDQSGQYGRPLLTCFPHEGNAIGEAVHGVRSREAEQVRGCIRIWRRTRDENNDPSRFTAAGRHRHSDAFDSDGSDSRSWDETAASRQEVGIGLGEPERLEVEFTDRVSFFADAAPLPPIQFVPQTRILALVRDRLRCPDFQIPWTFPCNDEYGWKKMQPKIRPPESTLQVPVVNRRPRSIG